LKIKTKQIFGSILVLPFLPFFLTLSPTKKQNQGQCLSLLRHVWTLAKVENIKNSKASLIPYPPNVKTKENIFIGSFC